MATTLEELEKRVSILEQTVAEMQRERRERPWPEEPPIWVLEGRQPTRDEMIAWLKARGTPIAEPTPEMRAHARRWRELPEEEKQTHREFMDSLELDPPLSQIIINNRR